MIFFIFGAGYSGMAFAMTQRVSIYGTVRNTAKIPIVKKANICPLLFNSVNLDPSLSEALAKTTHLIISIAPNSEGNDPVLALPRLRQSMPKLQWICYLSTVGVYGNHDGHWINETTSCHSILPRNKKRIAVEKDWQCFSKKYHIPLAILRLAGIYGPDRNVFVKLQQGNARRIIRPGQIFNRIHVADIAGAIKHLADKSQEGIFNICDNEPAPPQDVVTFAAKLMNIVPPTEISFERADLSPMAQSFYNDNKRVSNTLLRKSGYDLLYPDYREALTNMWQSKHW